MFRLSLNLNRAIDQGGRPAKRIADPNRGDTVGEEQVANHNSKLWQEFEQFRKFQQSKGQYVEDFDTEVEDEDSEVDLERKGVILP